LKAKQLDVKVSKNKDLERFLRAGAGLNETPYHDVVRCPWFNSWIGVTGIPAFPPFSAEDAEKDGARTFGIPALPPFSAEDAEKDGARTVNVPAFPPFSAEDAEKDGARTVNVPAFPPFSAEDAEKDGARTGLARAAEGFRRFLASIKSVAISGK
jgi:hypothetical protein